MFLTIYYNDVVEWNLVYSIVSFAVFAKIIVSLKTAWNVWS